MQMIVGVFYSRIKPPDHSSPVESIPGIGRMAIAEVVRRQISCSIVIEDVDLVVVERHHDLQLRIVVEMAHAQIQTVTAVAVVSWPIGIRVIARSGQGVLPGPGIPGEVRIGQLVHHPICSDHVYLRLIGVGLGVGSDDFNRPDVIRIGSGQPADFRPQPQ